jgi:hypothetical protein
MPDYERTTTETTLERLPAELRAALLERIDSALLTVPADAQAFITNSRPLRRGGLLSRLTGSADPDPEHDVAFVIGPSDLLVAPHGERRGTAVLVARLEDLELGSLTATLRARGMDVPEADGVDVTGFPVSGPDGGPGSYHVGLGPPAGEAARAALEQAIRTARA